MGKVPNKKKYKSAKSSPIINNASILESNDNNDFLTQASRSSDVLPVIKQLSSADPIERAWAASCVSNLIAGEEKIRRLLLSKNLISLLIERLTDDVYEVIYESVGTLRNLTVIGEYEICAEMFNKDILTPLMSLISKLSIIIDNMLKGISYESDPIKNARNNLWIFAENIICIIWALSETSQKILRGINNMNIVHFLMAFFINIEKIPIKTVIAAAQCLHTITDENSDIHRQFELNPQYIQIFLDIINLERDITLNDDELLIKVLCCGVILNLGPIIIHTVSRTKFNNDINNYLIPILKSCLNDDIEKVANETIEAASNVVASDIATEHPKDLSTSEEEKLISLNSRLTTLQLALELLSKICLECFTQDDDNYQDEIQNEENEIDFNKIKIMDVDPMSNDTYDQTSINRHEHPILNTFSTNIISDLIRLSRPTSLSYPEQLGYNVIPKNSIAPAITESLATVHLRAVECMNNFFLIMVDIVEEKWWFTKHRNAAKETWTRIVEVANQVAGKGVKVGEEGPGQKMRGTVLEALVGCLWILARGLNGDLPLAENQIQSFIQCYKSTVSESMRVKLIGTLGVIARRHHAIEDNKLIGAFLVEIIQDLSRTVSPPIDCITESLNAIYDIYADKDFDYDEPVFVHEGYLQMLESVIDNVHNMAKSIDKRKSPEQRLRVDEAYTNLVAFIRYKKDERL